MKKLASTAIAAVLAGVMAMPAPVSAAPLSFSIGQSRDFVSDRCERNSRLRGCDDHRRNGNRWSRNDYQQWYRWNQPSLGSVAAGFFGFAIGAAIAGSANRDRDGYGYRDSEWAAHVRACEARYRSYDARTDMFLGYDGNYHRCNL